MSQEVKLVCDSVATAAHVNRRCCYEPTTSTKARLWTVIKHTAGHPAEVHQGSVEPSSAGLA